MSWIMVGGAIVAGVGAIAQSNSQRKSLQYQADMQRQQAQVAQQQASVNEDAQRRLAAVQIGRQRAAAAADGGLSGTNLDLIGESNTNAELDALNIRYQGKLAAVTGQNQAALYESGAADAEKAGYLNAAAAALSAYGGYKRGSYGKLT